MVGVSDPVYGVTFGAVAAVSVAVAVNEGGGDVKSDRKARLAIAGY
jgi:hypothetical protein